MLNPGDHQGEKIIKLKPEETLGVSSVEIRLMLFYLQ